MGGNQQDAHLQRRGKRWRAWSLVLALVLVTGTLVWWFGRQILPDPIYQGKALSLWLRTYAPSSPFQPGSPKWEETDAAVRQIGTNGIPLLIQMLRQRDSKFKLGLLACAHKVGLAKQLHLVPARERVLAASRAFIALGNVASGAVPDLVQAYRETENAECRGAIADALAWIGPGAKPAIPLLLEAATDAHPKIRANALWALGEIHAEPQLCVPKLIHGLGDTDEWAQTSAAHALGKFGTNAKPAVPVLVGLASSTNLTIVRNGVNGLLMRQGVKLEARKALERIDAETFAHPTTNTTPVSWGFTTNGGFEFTPSAR